MTLLLENIDVRTLILNGFYVGVLISGTIGLFLLGVKIALKFFNKL